MIGIITFAICTLGVAIGNRFGARFKNKASVAGGVVLMLVGTKILLEHLGIINF
jgi:putative Mn2+ efflux pump MntP